MQIHSIDIDEKYLKGIEAGKITLLVFTRKIIHDYTPGDVLELKSGVSRIRTRIIKGYLKSFKEINETEAVSAGFLNKDFLKDDLYNHNDFDIITKLYGIDDVLLFLLSVVKEDSYVEQETDDKILNDEYTINYTINKYPDVDIFGKYKKMFYEERT